MEFGYWNIQGKARPIRELLTYLSVDYKEYSPENFESWSEKKESFKKNGFPLPNLPYLIDDKFSLSESQAIPSYLIYKTKQTDLGGKTLEERSNQIMLLGVINDIGTIYSTLICDEKYQEYFNNKKQQL